MMKKLIEIRDGTKDDEGFIYNSWIRSYRKSPFASAIDGQVYWVFQHKRIEDVLERGKVAIACAPDHPTQILGYLVYEDKPEGRIGHFIYVKATFRRFGIAKELIKAMDPLLDWYTHHTFMSVELVKRFDISYNPFLI